MNTHRHCLIALAFAALVLTGPAAADNVDLGKLVADSLKAMNESRWEDALADLNTATAPFAKGNADDYGPQFGVLCYRRGICELKLKRWHEAMKSFETCYRRYPNAGGKFTGGNVFGKRALLKWGEAALGAEDWALAIRQFDKFLAEIDKAVDSFPQGSFYINRCIACFKLGRIPEGNENLATVIANKEIFPTAEATIVAGFLAFVGAAIATNDEQSILDFIANNRADITLEPFEMTAFTERYMKLADAAMAADMQRAAMALYQLVPSTEAALDDTKLRLEALSAKRGIKDAGRMVDGKFLAENLKSLAAVRRGITSPDLTKLAATACLHEANGNIRGAYAAYEQLELYYPFALFDRANCHYAEDEGAQALDALSRLEKEFPNTEVMELALNLRGNIHQALGRLQDAEKSYLAALALAEIRGNSPAAGEALYYLVALLGTEGNPRSKEAVPYADRFWKDHAEGSPYRTQMAVAQWPALDAVGRGGEGLDRLWGIVMELAQAADPSGLEPALNSFVGLYLTKHTLAELREFLFNGPIGHQPEIRAVLRMALILGYESALNGRLNAEERTKAEAIIKVLFRELKEDFKLATLTPFILLRVGNHLATGNTPREAAALL